MDQSSIKEFYKGKSVFITGATGFIGKTLVEKLLWSCPDIKNIYIIVRSKKGKAVQERVDEITNSPAFDRIRAKNPESLNKIIALEGDITNENLGMSNEDLSKFYDNVNLIFHVAASIRMDEPIKNAVNNNTIPTKRLIAMAKKIKNLDAFVHISTAFSNWYRKELKEVPYLPSYDPNDIIKFANSMPENIQEKVESLLINSMDGVRPFPNTYTFSKFFAEAFVTVEGEGLPRAIVRPSIVVSSLNEPMPGWIDNWGGSTERLFQASAGMIHHLKCIPDMPLDTVPVDMVVNCAVAVGCKTAIDKAKDVQIYNYASGVANPNIFKQMFSSIEEFARKYPFNRVLWYPWIKLSNDSFSSKVMPILFEDIPARIIDFGLIISGKKPKMVKHHFHAKKNFAQLETFANTRSCFHTDNMLKFATSLSKNDQKEFPFDIRTVNWKSHMESYVLGVKKYLLKEDCSPEAIKKGQIKMQRLKTIHYGTKYALIGGSILLAGAILRCKLKSNDDQK